MSPANPPLVEVTRGDLVESVHRGAYAVVDSSGRLVASAGDVERLVYGRSAIKPLQALALIETGAADAFNLGVEEIALACASHNGEARHVEAVERWLGRLGLGVGDLECGADEPRYRPADETRVRAGVPANAAHNNCSGKHTGMLSAAVHLDEPTAGYIQREHPVQQRLAGVLSQMCDADLASAPGGIDGCGIPVFGISLRETALGMARLARPDGLEPSRARAVERVIAAMTAAPFMVDGTGRFCTEVMAAAGGRIATKTGAEGFFTAALPGPGLGIAVKIDDGASRASEVAMGALLTRYAGLDEATLGELARWFRPANVNVAGRTVGEIRPGADV